MKAIELFAGVGGFRLGLERAGHEVIWANEWDKYACDVYDYNFSANESATGGRPRQSELEHQPTMADTSGERPEQSTVTNLPGDKIDRRDITTIPAADIPAHDLICGGFPCQAFSVAGKRKGFDETRGTLFFDILRIARHHRTPYLLLENVKGLLNHDGGKTFEVIMRALAECGYDAEWQVLNSKNFGVPQNRERVFIVGHLRGQPRPQVFPLAGTDGADIAQLNPGTAQDQRIYADSGVSPTLNPAAAAGGPNVPKIGVINRGKFKDTDNHALTITANYHKGPDNHGQRPMVLTGSPSYKDGKRQVDYHLSDEAPTIRATQHKSGDNQPKIVQRQPLRFLDRNQKNIEGDYAFTVDASQTSGVRITGINHPSRGMEPRPDGLAATLKSGQSGTQRPKAVIGTSIRRLTPIECERLQAFPDNWTKYGLKPDGTEYEVSDTQRYKMMGNAVTTNVVYEVAKMLKGEIAYGVHRS